MLWVAIILVSCLLITSFILYERDRIEYNGGKCTECGAELSLIDKDDDDTRKYVCPKCGRAVYVSMFNPEKRK